ncbi:MAG: DUF2089 family protein [Planctomycetota bacterium]
MTPDFQKLDASHPLLQLPREDLNLVTALVLHSGSLKALAKVYGVSYPTIRARLDKTIERLRAAVDGEPADPLREMLADLVGRGQINKAEAERLAELAQRNAEPMLKLKLKAM